MNHVLQKKSYDAISRQDWRAAEQNLRRLCKGAKAQASDFYNLAKVLEQVKKFEQIPIWLRRAIQHNPNYVAALYEMGRWEVNHGSALSAYLWLKKAYTFDPSDSDICELFLSVACKTGHWETAGQLLARAQPSPKNVAEMYRVQCELRKLTLSKQYTLINDNAGPEMLHTITKVSCGVLPFRIG